MEGGGDSASAPVIESVSHTKDDPQGILTQEQGDRETKKEERENVSLRGTGESLKDANGDKKVEDGVEHQEDSSLGDSNHGNTNGMKLISSKCTDLVQQEDGLNHKIISSDNSGPAESTVEDNVEEPLDIVVQSGTTCGGDFISDNAILGPDNIRTTNIPCDENQPSQQLRPQEEVQMLEPLSLDSAEGTATGSVNAHDNKSASSTKASSNSSMSKIADYNSPEALLLSISQDVSEKFQRNQTVKKTSESHSRPLNTGDSASLGKTSQLVLHSNAEIRDSIQTGNKNEARKTEVANSTCVVQKDSRTESSSIQLAKTSLEQDDDLLSELDAELDEFFLPQKLDEGDPMNGVLRRGVILEDLPEVKLMKVQSDELHRKVDSLNGEIKRMQEHLSNQQQQISDLEQEKESLQLNVKQAESVQTVHLLRIKELELLIDQQKIELAASKERQLSHDAAAKKAITQLQQEMILRVDQVKSMYEEAIKEKEAVVIKYAKSEKEVLDQKKQREILEKSFKELNLSVESLKTQLHDIKKERSKLKNTATSKETEASYLQKEVDQLKEEISSQGIKVKWAQNKLKTELDAHKETKVKLAKVEQRLKEAKEETEQIRKNCQEMIKTYQTSEEVKSNSLDRQLREKHSELEEKLQEQKEHLEVHQARLRELESLKKNLADNVAELDSLKVKNKCLESERHQNEELLAKFKELLNSQKEENRRLNKQLEEKKSLTQELENLKETEKQLRSEVSGQKSDQSDLEMELQATRQKESELLQFTEKITSKNTSLSSDNAALQLKASQLESAVQKLERDLDELQTSYSQLSTELKQECQLRERESSLLTSKLTEKSRAVEQLSIQLDEARDDNKTLKRKHAANTKDLTRQLQQAHKRLESLDSSENPSRDNISVGSRTSSSGSLDTLPGSAPSVVNSSGSSVSVSTPASLKPEEHTATHDPTVAIATGNDYPGVDKGMLVDRIVRLQKAHQRKNEKMEFMQEHITHLVEELKKKSKIIQQYIMRDEAGALVPVSSDVNKAQISKQGGIMSSLYRSQSTDPTMTLDLSLEINRKLQAVLEDTLLKNITLKENIETLGQEIARLLKEQQKHQSGPR
ncbi:coiled-coil domain-containing protein 186-like isoform X2 [Acanthaster planci]|uniref:Coiled-coil domain-containing protein 186-like isoform X2 n=1 Tax=Acanthaster planci TaxID=133434 RepID=A0A8B7XJ23_ACAPL|nr:coiled-coil domain-containing protein 186-like isoform X2 [Acanthaster planci]